MKSGCEGSYMRGDSDRNNSYSSYRYGSYDCSYDGFVPSIGFFTGSGVENIRFHRA